MDDIAQRLRATAGERYSEGANKGGTAGLLEDAAHEIDRLRARLDEAEQRDDDSCPIKFNDRPEREWPTTEPCTIPNVDALEIDPEGYGVYAIKKLCEFARDLAAESQRRKERLDELDKQKPITSEVKEYVQHHPAEIEYRNSEGKVVGYWAYGHFDPSLPYQGDTAPTTEVPEGYALVPVEPTHDMLLAGNRLLPAGVNSYMIYADMLAAAPQLQRTEEGETQ